MPSVLEFDGMFYVMGNYHNVIGEFSSRLKAEEFSEYACKHGNLKIPELLERVQALEWTMIFYTMLWRCYGVWKNEDDLETDVDAFVDSYAFNTLYKQFTEDSSKNGNPEIPKHLERAREWVQIYKTILYTTDTYVYDINDDDEFNAHVDAFVDSDAFKALYEEYG
jgi:hypothetical protein